MSGSEFHHSTRDEFLAEFYPDPADKAAITAGMEQLRAEQRAVRLAEMRRRLGITQTQVAARMGITQGRVSAIEHAKPGTTELRTLAAYVEALGGRLEIIADFGDQRLAFTDLAPKQPKPRGTSCPAGRGHGRGPDSSRSCSRRTWPVWVRSPGLLRMSTKCGVPMAACPSGPVGECGVWPAEAGRAEPTAGWHELVSVA